MIGAGLIDGHNHIGSRSGISSKYHVDEASAPCADQQSTRVRRIVWILLEDVIAIGDRPYSLDRNSSLEHSPDGVVAEDQPPSGQFVPPGSLLALNRSLALGWIVNPS